MSSNTKMVIRTGVFFIIGICAAIFPWWVTCITVCLALVYFDFYIEALFFGVVLDVLSVPDGVLNKEVVLSSIQFTVAFGIIFLLIMRLKERFLIRIKV